MQVGESTDARFSDDLMQREARYGRSMFALQFQLDTSLADADRYPLKLGDLRAGHTHVVGASKGAEFPSWVSNRLSF